MMERIVFRVVFDGILRLRPREGAGHRSAAVGFPDALMTARAELCIDVFGRRGSAGCLPAGHLTRLPCQTQESRGRPGSSVHWNTGGPSGTADPSPLGSDAA